MVQRSKQKVTSKSYGNTTGTKCSLCSACKITKRTGKACKRPNDEKLFSSKNVQDKKVFKQPTTDNRLSVKSKKEKK